ncbi:TadE family protein [Roseibium sp. TrichSKD4]|nr:TadE family protein [Roseibium sp. TrichSKD4]
MFYSVIGRLLRRYTRNDQGVTAIEFAIVGTPFFMLIFGILEFGLAFFVNRIVDNAVLETARLVRTGQAKDFNDTKFRNALCANMPSIFCVHNRMVIKVDKLTDFSGAGDNYSTLPPLLDDDDEPTDDSYPPKINRQEVVVVRVLYQWPMFSAYLNLGDGDTSGKRNLFSAHIFQTEPW